jgi:2-hydroxy-4-(methylsulfanyl)butanoate S-methyltransferase
LAAFETPDDVLGCLRAYSSSAALGAALELRLPWLLAERPRDASAISAALGIPARRCLWWLAVLERIGLLEQGPEGYRPTPGARRAILGTYHPESWAFLAREERERFPTVLELAHRLTLPPGAAGLPGPAPDYVQLMAADPERARAFTRMLYDLHGPLARCLASALDLGRAERLLDLGGGSGVVSLALLRQNPGLEVVVVDLPTVCAEGRRIARQESLGDRITFWEGDLLGGGLPRGFDAVLECDVGVYHPDLFAAVRESLHPNGRFFVVDLLPETEDDFPERVLHWGFSASIAMPEGRPATWPRLVEMLQAAGLRPGPATPLIEGFRLLEARR